METIYSDHRYIECATTYDETRPGKENSQEKEEFSSHNFDRFNFFNDTVDWDNMNHKLMSHDWKAEFRALSVEDMMERFLNVCLHAADECVPLKTREREKKTRSKIPRDRSNLMRKRRRINTQLQKTRSESMRNKLKLEARNIEKERQRSYRSSREYCESKAVGAI